MDNVVTSIYISKEQCEQLDKLAVKMNITRTELIRSYITKGLTVDGHLQELDIITSVIRQELNAIYRPEEIKSMVSDQVDRIAKMQMKVGKMEAGSYFLLVKMMMRIWADPDMSDCFAMVRDTQDLGIGYMQINDGDINRFLQDTDNLVLIAKGIVDDGTV